MTEPSAAEFEAPLGVLTEPTGSDFIGSVTRKHSCLPPQACYFQCCEPDDAQ
ncbi:hypothetical protein GLOTRDRAFT_111233 [Gloeophyllum trabeum ATCC 11539]|uniref:Uncharacterized protein n=1 Tax=Gloeophyllum trabeum (strain ATCC 11539 / FP-39264 / Madison 617) TaxID=670483 RepID=S7RR72_GLOTA|nr:uncharacterized protein GLOTRDRAFT_111233 [Gloeophyllum trabeum ATCC 11539]EPQ55424.1 hypothetical protein GLOTRDRAFT_111233 [Gloeophyllum trabeum ATCC 11539]